MEVALIRQARAAGRTHYSLLRMIRFAWTGISSFSAFPLRLSIAAGCLLSLIGFGYLIYVFWAAFFTTTLVRGWASIIAAQCVFSGITLLALGAIGDYVARIYEESKGRPLYIVAGTCNLSARKVVLPRAVILDSPFAAAPFSTLDTEVSLHADGLDSSAVAADCRGEHSDERVGISSKFR